MACWALAVVFGAMANVSDLTRAEVEVARARRLEAMRLQEIESNPLSADQIAMFELLEREAWSHARRRAHILARVTPVPAE